MRVLLTTDTVGGVWTFTRELSVGLLDRGHSVALVSLGREPSVSQQAWVSEVEYKYGAEFWYQAASVPLEWMEGNQFAYSDAEGTLLGMADRFAVDLVHASQFCFGALPVKVPKIVTAHSDVLSWAAACRPVALEQSDWLTRYESLVSAGLSGADMVVAPTYWMLHALSQRFALPAEMHVILNGRTLPKIEESKTRQMQAVTVGRLWDEAKGLAVLNGADACMPILIAGETDFYNQLISEPKNVKLLGSMAERELVELFQVSSLYVATSIYEPFGLAPLEAALCGCGVLARDIPSLREVWGSAAEYFADGTTLCASMLRLRDSTADLAGLQARSMRRALELSADRMIDAYVSLYKDSLTRASAHEEVAAHAG